MFLLDPAPPLPSIEGPDSRILDLVLEIDKMCYRAADRFSLWYGWKPHDLVLSVCKQLPSVRIRHLRVCSRLFFVSSVSSASAFVTDASVTVTSNWSYYMPNCGHIFCLEVGVLLQGLLSPFWGDAFLSHHVNATWYGLFCIKAVDYIVYRACLCSVEVVYLRSRLLRLQDSLKSASYMRHRSRLICIHARVQPITHLVWYSSSDLKIPFVDPAPSNSRPSWRRRARWRFHFMAL